MTQFSSPFTQGGQTQLHKLRMMQQVLGMTTKISLGMGGLIFLCLSLYAHTTSEVQFLFTYFKAYVRCLFNFLPHGLWDTSWVPYGPSLLEVHDTYLLRDSSYQKMAARLCSTLRHHAFLSLMLTLLIFLGLSLFWISRGKRRQQAQFVSGSSIVPPQTFKHLIEKEGASTISLGGVPLLKDRECEHMMITGTTGAGKSNTMHHLLQQIQKMNHGAIIVDTTGGLVERFYRESQDLLLNPLDLRDKKWTVWKEIISSHDADEIAESLIPQTSHDPFWTNAARQVLSDTLMYCKQVDPSLPAVIDLLLNQPLKETMEVLQGTASASLMDPSLEKVALSIRATLSHSLRPLSSLDPAGDFSIREWVSSSSNSWLFLSCKPDQREFLRPLLSTWISLAVKSLMRLKEDPSRRLWVIIDELASLNKISSLCMALSEARKYGGCFVLGFQDLAQLEERYGHHQVQSLTSLTGTKLIFRTGDPTLARKLSDILGDQEIIDPSESLSFGAHQARDGINLSGHLRVKPLVRPSCILSLNNLEAFLKLPGHFPIIKLKFPYLNLEKKAQAFIPK